MRQIIADGVATGAFGPVRSEADVVRDSRRRQLDSALVQARRSGELAGDRRSVADFLIAGLRGSRLRLRRTPRSAISPARSRHATIIVRHGHDRSADRRPTPRAEAGMAEGPRARVAELPAPQGADARPQPAHGVRGSALPQHRRVLEPRDGDVHDPRRRLHARLLVLRRRARPAGRGRCRGTRARRPRHPDARPQLRRHHLGGPRRPG